LSDLANRIPDIALQSSTFGSCLAPFPPFPPSWLPFSTSFRFWVAFLVFLDRFWSQNAPKMVPKTTLVEFLLRCWFGGVFLSPFSLGLFPLQPRNSCFYTAFTMVCAFRRFCVRLRFRIDFSSKSAPILEYKWSKDLLKMTSGIRSILCSLLVAILAPILAPKDDFGRPGTSQGDPRAPKLTPGATKIDPQSGQGRPKSAQESP
jgi:hypothetical protein